MIQKLHFHAHHSFHISEISMNKQEHIFVRIFQEATIDCRLQHKT